MSIKPVPKRYAIRATDSDLFTVLETDPSQDSMGFPIRATPTSVSNVPGNLQPMSAQQATQYGAESSRNLWMLYLPVYYGSNAILAVTGWYFQDSGGVQYRALGDGIEDGSSGRQRVPVEAVER
jgi:hypothetical protein